MIVRGRFSIDTNILVYAADGSAGKRGVEFIDPFAGDIASRLSGLLEP